MLLYFYFNKVLTARPLRVTECFCTVVLLLFALVQDLSASSTLTGINSYEDLGGKALQKPGKVSCVCQKRNTLHYIFNMTRRCIHTDHLFKILFRSWLELLLSSKISVVSQLLFNCTVPYIIFDMLDINWFCGFLTSRVVKGLQSAAGSDSGQFILEAGSASYWWSEAPVLRFTPCLL